MEVVNSQKGEVFFLWLWRYREDIYLENIDFLHKIKKTMLFYYGFIQNIIILLPRGRTIHSMLKISISTLESSTCNINKENDRAKLLKLVKLIIWDEAVMAHKYNFKPFNKTLKDIMAETRTSKHIFEGKVIVFGGDFRKIYLLFQEDVVLT